MNRVKYILPIACLSLWTAGIFGASLEISGAQLEIFGSTTDVTGSGTSANFDVGTVEGDFAVFDIQEEGGGDFADLRVTYTTDDGGLGSNVMIAQTSNSQGLTDSGTLSILITVGTSGGGGEFTFDWFTPGSFSGGVIQGSASFLSTPIQYTTFDIDFEQYVAPDGDKLHSYGLASDTLLSVDEVERDPLFSFEDANVNSTFDDPRTAAQFTTQTLPSSLVIGMGKQFSNGNALFMFEFRDPSDILVGDFPPIIIPEISSISLIGLAGLAWFLVGKRRTRRKA